MNRYLVLVLLSVLCLPFLSFPEFAQSTQLVTVTFVEHGLPAGTSWSVTLNGTTLSTNTTEITFHVQPGELQYNISPVHGLVPTPSFGTLYAFNYTVVNVTYAPPYVKLVLEGERAVSTASGAPVSLLQTGQTYQLGALISNQGNEQTVVLENLVLTKGSIVVQNETIVLSLSPGQTSFGAFLWTPQSNGIYNLTVTATGMQSAVTSTYLVYVGVSPLVTVTFVEHGLPAGTSWSVTLNGTTLSTNTTEITFHVHNGTYTYVVHNPSFFDDLYPNGSLTVKSTGATVGVLFLPLLVEPAVTAKLSNATSVGLITLRANSTYYVQVSIENMGNVSGPIDVTIVVKVNGQTTVDKSFNLTLPVNGSDEEEVQFTPTSVGNYSVAVYAFSAQPYGQRESSNLTLSGPITTSQVSHPSVHVTNTSTTSNRTSITSPTPEKGEINLTLVLVVIVVVVIAIALVLLLRR
ncbi:hypothetical protein HS1genome_0877 [Sulfodiicoccus acidiphilus]|uniref:CARDB domain-containing protein n=1 Tax=Sulfodiicoccus acidiphilus TaxID=1670455 RepID=A0A348B2T6_9CREN|nr:hypothetical protein [Sulfodiicoccus acidiphilus]BBD72488.1 hypothetical protein HS1genome_0877 [Sulfodiicoccus acidiphilus]GGT96763.1 hypothetical protein GCM10007116_12820 [Sulfodiicoccus acidiphilus]